MVNGQWSMLNGQCSMVNGKRSITTNPIIYQLTSQTRAVGHLGQIIPSEPPSSAQFRALKLKFTSVIIGRKTHHESCRIGPRLGGKVTDVLDVQVGFLPHFATNTLFQSLARLYEACHKTIEMTAEIVSMHHEHFIATRHPYNDGSLQLRPYFLATLGAMLRNLSMPLHGCTTTAAILRILVPINQLCTLARQLIKICRKDVGRLSKTCHLQVRAIGYGIVQSEYMASALTLNNVRYMFPRLEFDGSRITKRNVPLTREEDIPLAICKIKVLHVLSSFNRSQACSRSFFDLSAALTALHFAVCTLQFRVQGWP